MTRVKHSFTETDSRRDDMSEAIEEWIDELTENVEEFQESEEFKEYLDVASKFHNYSLNNQALIKMQMPEATRVAGYKTWESKFNRTVKEGESAIWIWAPIITNKCPECGNSKSYHNNIGCDYDEKEPSEWSEGVVAFRPRHVFDVSQTEGEELPELNTEAYGNAEGLKNALLQSSKNLEVPVVEIQDESEWNHGNARGVMHKDTGAVEVLKRENEADLVRTMIHEFAHYLLHMDEQDKTEKSKREVEAESVAYVVGRHFGLDVSNSAFYLISWSGDEPEAIKERLNRISKTSKKIIENVENELD